MRNIFEEIEKSPELKSVATKKKKLDLLGHVERIVELSETYGLTDEFFDKAKTHIDFVRKVLGLTNMQVVLFSHFVDQSEERHIYIGNIAKALKCRSLRIIRHMTDLEELEKRKLIRCSRDKDCFTYRVPLDVINALKKGENYIPPSCQNISIQDFFTVMNDLFDQRTDKGELTFDALSAELDALMDDNRQLSFVRQIRNYGFSEDDSILLLFFCHLFVNNDDDSIRSHDFEDLYEDKSDFMFVKRALERNRHILQKNKLIENQNSDGFGDKEYFKLTDKAKQELLSELELKPKIVAKKDLILSTSLVEKTLFYNPKEARQVLQLSHLLEVENFKTVQQRLTDNGMRTGFACLFYGAPGTGKTETVHQLARETGRDIMQVDISAIKSKWFGESEKNIKEVFDRYRNHVNDNEVAPVLLFNEADAIIGKRMENTRAAVDQASNAIQNIILQEIENLNGILIATTNLTQNLDKAFERRFLYKIEFEKPSIEVKQSIWESMMPDLSESEAHELASLYDFSGGQIENIVRKRMIDDIINGNECSMVNLHAHCQSELLNKDNQRKNIGFMRE
jgi:hypothetical protein